MSIATGVAWSDYLHVVTLFSSAALGIGTTVYLCCRIAAKVTGRAGGYTVGLLDAVTNRETARFRADTTAGAPTLTQEVEPLTNYFVGRVRRDLRGGATSLGAILTSTTRRPL